jgi:hypothetical protein
MSTRLPAATPPFLACPDAHRQRLDEGGGIVTDGVRNRVSEGGVNHNLLRECAVNWRRREEAHLGTQVVATGQALGTTQVRHAGFDGNALSDRPPDNSLTHRFDHARGLVAKNDGPLNYEASDPSMFVVVRVRTADADRIDSDQDLVWARTRTAALLNGDAPRAMQH